MFFFVAAAFFHVGHVKKNRLGMYCYNHTTQYSTSFYVGRVNKIPLPHPNRQKNTVQINKADQPANRHVPAPKSQYPYKDAAEESEPRKPLIANHVSKY